MVLFDKMFEELHDATGRILSAVTEEQFRQVVDAIIAADRVFIYGAGRSGLAGRFLGMRLMHTGKTVYMVGDTTTPAFREKDLLIIISGSGNTSSALNTAEKGKAAGGLVLVITGKRADAASNRLAAFPGITLQLPVPAAGRQEPGVVLFPLGTLFEVSALLFLETAAAAIIDINRIKEQDLQTRHANLE